MRLKKRHLLNFAALLCAAAIEPALAQQAAPQDTRTPVTSSKAASPNAMVNLVNMLVKQGVFTAEQGQALIKQAEDEAYIARQASQVATTKADDAAKAANAAANAVSPPGTKHVTYVPDIVKRELREQIKQEVMDKAKDEKWAAPNTFPDWAQRIHFSGDVRVRYEADLFPKGNDTASATLMNWNAINTGSPFDFTAGPPPPLRDVDQDRNRFRLRARLGMEANLYDGFTAGLRIATGDSSTPVSTNVTLGGGGGNFSKYPLWLDRGWLRYATPSEDAVAWVGRFDNPFFAPTDLMWYGELGFDGVALQFKHDITPDRFAANWHWHLPGVRSSEAPPPSAEGEAMPTKAPASAPPFVVTPFAVVGAFPLFNTPPNFSLNGSRAFDPAASGADAQSDDKYLFAAQGGVGVRFNPDVSAKFGVGYFDFLNVQGQFSHPCLVQTAADLCDTDILRPSFAQFGNTYMALRNIIPIVANNGANQFQFYGLASAFRVVELTGSLDFAHFNPVHVILDGTYLRNEAFHPDDIDRVALNNRAGTTLANQTGGPFNGGNQGAMTRVSVGYPELKHLWDWKASVAYKYLESDAVMDAFTDPDFGLGGTNLKGYVVGLNVGLGANVWTSIKWMSANSIAGAPFAVDVLQLDLNGRF
jgi:hypothetical protein